MDAASIAKEVARFLKGSDEIAEAKIAEHQEFSSIDIEVKTQGGVAYLVTVEKVEE